MAGAVLAAAPALAEPPRSVELRDASDAVVRVEPGARERAVVLHFFASWCPECAEELPVLAAAQAACHPERVRIVAVDAGEDAATARAFLNAHAPSLPLLLDPKGAAWRGAGLHGLPANLILRAGASSDTTEGPTAADGWRTRLEALGCGPAAHDP